ncbi:endonuclease/exonuclease/phosphatase family protein [Nocardioides aequoreus]|uniref:endonuclease/exonuclease/phosphatase family protein n=1 Tax=Nocardioides aequoreus TaxID=397278 RepID=UPI0012F674A6|nr:endonuclease/exonuclease/phosphatase family protein [Nocardioides aequoreus]
MRQKVGMAGVVVLVLAIWVTGFLWARGDLDLSTAGAPASEPTSEASSSAAPSATASATPDEPASPPPLSAAPRRQGDPIVDPELLAELREGVQVEEPPVVDTVVASFNLLGADHSEPGGTKPGFAGWSTRLDLSMRALDRARVSLVGFQEMQPVQARAFAARARGWQMHPQASRVDPAGRNVVAWRSAEWELVQGGSVPITYFSGEIMNMPVALLRHRETGMLVYASSFHNPASTPRRGNQLRWRDEATRRQIALVQRLRRTGIPHLMTGDFNEPTKHFCRLTGATGFTSPAGGSHDGTCRPPARPLIDWIYGDPEVEWTAYAGIRDATVRRASDHALVVGGVRLDASRFPDAWSGEVVTP